MIKFLWKKQKLHSNHYLFSLIPSLITLDKDEIKVLIVVHMQYFELSPTFSFTSQGWDLSIKPSFDFIFKIGITLWALRCGRLNCYTKKSRTIF